MLADLSRLAFEEAPGWPLPSRTAFVLSGGGGFGAMQVGMLRALYEQGIVPDSLVGTSAGAMNAAFIATRPQTVATAKVMLPATNPRRVQATDFAHFSRLIGAALDSSRTALAIGRPAAAIGA